MTRYVVVKSIGVIDENGCEAVGSIALARICFCGF